VGRADILLGYLLGFMVFATVQTIVILLFTIFVLRIDYQGNIFEIGAVLMLVVIVAVSLGIFISTFARNEFQVVQFIPIVFVPQVFLSGVIIPVDQMPAVMEGISNALPLTYAVKGLREIMLQGHGLTEVWPELGVLAAFGVSLLAAAAVTLRRT
jgi:ABC-2 type transport system permease protein